MQILLSISGDLPLDVICSEIATRGKRKTQAQDLCIADYCYFKTRCNKTWQDSMQMTFIIRAGRCLQKFWFLLGDVSKRIRDRAPDNKFITLSERCVIHYLYCQQLLLRKDSCALIFNLIFIVLINWHNLKKIPFNGLQPIVEVNGI